MQRRPRLFSFPPSLLPSSLAFLPGGQLSTSMSSLWARHHNQALSSFNSGGNRPPATSRLGEVSDDLHSNKILPPVARQIMMGCKGARFSSEGGREGEDRGGCRTRSSPLSPSKHAIMSVEGREGEKSGLALFNYCPPLSMSGK